MSRAKKSPLVNYVAIALDKSSSMSSIRQETIDAFNSVVRAIREQSEAEGQTTYVSLVTFDSVVRVETYPTDVRNIKQLTLSSYQPGGMTALFDGAGCAADTLEGAIAGNADVSFVVLGITDGEENASRRYNNRTFAKRLKELESDDRWTVAFQVPRGARDGFCRQFGIPQENVREWEANAQGTREAAADTAAAFTGYFAARSAGLRSVKNFYRLTADMSKVAVKDVKCKLNDLSDGFSVYEVGAEEPIREFVERKTRKPYVIGSVAYQLTKSEVVQPDKRVYIIEKGKKAIWGGNEARQLVGLPTDNSTHAKVTPGNLSSFDVFVESRSVNRKLVRGTKVLVNKNQKRDLTPTWDHTAVAAANS